MAEDRERFRLQMHKFSGTLRYLAADRAGNHALRMEAESLTASMESLKQDFETFRKECGRVESAARELMNTLEEI